MELVSDGTSNTPTVNVMRIITACTPYRSWSSNPSPEPATRSRTVLETNTSLGDASAAELLTRHLRDYLLLFLALERPGESLISYPAAGEASLV